MDARTRNLISGLKLYGGYRRWMADIIAIVNETTEDGHMWGMGSLGRGNSRMRRIDVRVRAILDGGTFAETDRTFWLLSYAQGDDLSFETAETEALAREMWRGY